MLITTSISKVEYLGNALAATDALPIAARAWDKRDTSSQVRVAPPAHAQHALLANRPTIYQKCAGLYKQY